MRGYVGYVDGGLTIDGSEEAPVREEQVLQRCQEIKEAGLKAVVIAGVYSPIDEVFHQEDRVREIVAGELPGVDVVCSHEVANIGFMERENAAILNASILKYARRTVNGFRAAMKRLKLDCGLYITQNDGTLVDSAAAARLPIRTFCSGATNSMRGASYLAGIGEGGKSTIVVDVGGTTTDVGVLLPNGFPRQAAAYVKVAGVQVNYSMPLLYSIGLGGGSLVQEKEKGKKEGGAAKVEVGPQSVGHYLSTDAVVFGGKQLTATDISVAAGRANIGERALVSDLSPELVGKAQDTIKVMLERVIDLSKTSPEDLPVLLVGGGSIIAPTSLKGASELISPPSADVANAVGAAVAQIGGTVDIVQNTSSQTVNEATELAKKLAAKRAIESGADPDSVRIAEVDVIPLQYVQNQVRTIVKAIGDLQVGSDGGMRAHKIEKAEEKEEDDELEEIKVFDQQVPEDPVVDPLKYKPDVRRNGETGIAEWFISETDLSWLADGCYVLGCAGGGSPNSTRIQLRDQLRAGHQMRVVDVSAIADNASIYWGGHMGSPAVSVERLASTETIEAMHVLMDHLREDSFDAIMGLEIGGGNGLEPLLVGSSKFFNRPVIDADWMGRAYPTYWQTTLAAHEPGQLVPCAIDSGDGKSMLMTRASNDEIVDRALRASCAEMGSRVGMAAKPTTTDRVRNFGVMNTLSLAWRIGRCIATAEHTNTLSRVAEAIVDEVGGDKAAKILFRGKIVAVERRLHKGHSFGEVSIASLPPSELEGSNSTAYRPAVASSGTLKIPFKNENILAEHFSDSSPPVKTMLATVPDLICILDATSGRSLGVPEFRYGLRVTVVGITCSPRWTDVPLALEIGGPGAFGYEDVEYRPLGIYVEPRSVVEEFCPE